MDRRRAAQSKTGPPRRDPILPPATETRSARLDETRAHECLSRFLPAEQATPQYRCSIAHCGFVFPIELQWLEGWEVPRPVRPISALASNSMLMAETAEELRKRPEIRKE